MLSLKNYFIKRRKQRERRTKFRLQQKAQKKIESIKANLRQEKNKELKKWLIANQSIEK